MSRLVASCILLAAATAAGRPLSCEGCSWARLKPPHVASCTAQACAVVHLAGISWVRVAWPTAVTVSDGMQSGCKLQAGATCGSGMVCKASCNGKAELHPACMMAHNTIKLGLAPLSPNADGQQHL